MDATEARDRPTTTTLEPTMIASLSRNFASSLLAVAACASLVIGCAGDDSSASATDPTTTDPTSSTSTSTTTDPTVTPTETSTTDPTTSGTSSSSSDTSSSTGDPTTGSICGDGTQDDGEQCDDGNNDDGDGCSAECTTEGEVMCDPQVQDCPEGQKCTASNVMTGDFWNKNVCTPIMGTKTLGESCDVLGQELGGGADDCDLGLICLQFAPDGTDGICTSFCNADSQCDAPKDICVPVNEGILPICLSTCDPLIQDCPFDQGCYGDMMGELFICFKPDPQSGGMDNDDCAFDNACVAGFQCMPPEVVEDCDQGNMGCCNPFCDITGDNSECGGGEVCTPFFGEDNMVPPWEDVGICTLP